MLRWIAILMLVVTLPGLAQNAPDEAAKRLASVRIFAFGGVGFADMTSPGELDYRAIMAQPPELAETEFENLFATGNPQAKAYALTGLKRLNSPKFQELVHVAESSDDKVMTMHGCMGSHQLLREIAAQIERQNVAPHNEEPHNVGPGKVDLGKVTPAE